MDFSLGIPKVKFDRPNLAGHVRSMKKETLKRIAVTLTLLGLGYGAGATAPAAAYTQDPYRVLNNIAGELRGIRSSLQSIERKMR